LRAVAERDRVVIQLKSAELRQIWIRRRGLSVIGIRSLRLWWRSLRRLLMRAAGSIAKGRRTLLSRDRAPSAGWTLCVELRYRMMPLVYRITNCSVGRSRTRNAPVTLGLLGRLHDLIIDDRQGGAYDDPLDHILVVITQRLPNFLFLLRPTRDGYASPASILG
jgi:hypothetical protein